jgi:hypothetical protein
LQHYTNQKQKLDSQLHQIDLSEEVRGVIREIAEIKVRLEEHEQQRKLE